MKHDVPANAARSDEFVNYPPAMPNLSDESSLFSRIVGRLVGHQ